MSKTIEIGERTYELPFRIEDAGVTTDIVDTKGHLLMGWHGRRTELGNVITAALNDYRPWRYPARGEWPTQTGEYEVTALHGMVVKLWFTGLAKFIDVTGTLYNIRAWRELPEPAPVIEE